MNTFFPQVFLDNFPCFKSWHGQTFEQRAPCQGNFLCCAPEQIKLVKGKPVKENLVVYTRGLIVKDHQLLILLWTCWRFERLGKLILCVSWSVQCRSLLFYAGLGFWKLSGIIASREFSRWLWRETFGVVLNDRERTLWWEYLVRSSSPPKKQVLVIKLKRWFGIRFN